jgi:hypothetical protein
MRTSKQNPTEQHQSAPTMQTPKLPTTPEQIRQRARAIYTARGGMEGMALNDWLKAEQELKRELERDNSQL